MGVLSFQTQNSIWKRHYADYVKKQTLYYEHLNSIAETVTHKATPEETEYYMGLLKPKTSVHKLKLVKEDKVNDKL